MAFQISIGDILMLSKLAWDISQAFTSGRKSAPAEFQEVQNQLISLTHALESLKSLSSETSGPEDGYSFNTIAPILQNCRFTLEHLEALVSKYMVIVKDSGLDGSEKKRWREELQKNWKKVRWTREGGDLMRLQHNLGVHITSLNLTITVLNSANNQKLGQQVHDAHEMLKEIHVWFTSNLKDRPISFNEAPSTPQEESLKLAFSLHRGDDELFETAPLCDNASFNVDWLRGPDEDKPVFKCNCQLRRTTYGDIHDEELGQYLESQMTLIVCSNGLSQSWKILWLTRASRLTSLIIRSITPSGLGIFDGIISKLAITMARKAWNRGAASLMAYPSINPYTELPVIFVLNMLCETGRLYGKIETVKFTANGRSYSTGPIEAVQMVHYRNLTETLAWSFNEAADLILDARSDTHNSDSIEDEAVEYTITVSDQTLITHGENASVVRIAEADCLSRTESGQENTVKGVGVEIELPDINSAIYFVQQLNSLQEGLLGVRTQELLRNEKLAFKIDLGIMIVYDYQITNAVLYLVMNVQTKNYRMLISNASRSICLSIELSSEALRQVSESEQISIPCDGPVWIAECSNLDRKIVYQQRSRSGLTCADRRAQQLLMLMLQSVVRGKISFDCVFILACVDRNTGDHTNEYPMIEGRQYEIEG